MGQDDSRTIRVTGKTYRGLAEKGRFGEPVDHVLQRILFPASLHDELRLTLAAQFQRREWKNQWTAPVGQNAPAARLRNFIMMSDAVVGEPGETVSIPYVKSYNLEIGEVGAKIISQTEIVDVVQATVKEATFGTDLTYSLAEKVTPQIFAELESQFEQAAFRAEDKRVLDLLAEEDLEEVDHSGENDADFKATYLGEALAKIKGADVGLLVLVVNLPMFGKLLENMGDSQTLGFARPGTMDGLVTNLGGINIAVSDYLPGESFYNAYLIHRNAAVLAPKSGLGLGSARDTRARVVKVSGSYPFAAAITDVDAAVEIKTAFAVPPS